MERLSTQPTGAGPLTQDGNACISLCYQPVNVQTVENQTAVAVQSLIDSQGIHEAQDEEEDIFQCGKCKKQFTSIQLFLNHKQTQCVLQQQQNQLQQQQQVASQQLQQQPLTLSAGGGMFAAPTLNIGRSFTQSQVNNTAPILQAHPVLSRSLNQPTNGQTLTLTGLPSSPMPQLPQNMIFTGDDLMALANLDTTSLNTSSIQMVTGTVQANNSNSVTILSPISGLASSSPNGFSAPTATGAAGGQLLMQPTQQITLATITDKGVQQTHQPQVLQQQQVPPQPNQMPPPPAPPPLVQFPTIHQQPTQAQIQHQHLQLQQQQQQLQQIFKPSPTKAGRKSAQNFITVLSSENNSSNSVSLLSTRKGKTARNATGNNIINSEGQEGTDAAAKSKLRCEYCNKMFSKNFDLQQHIRAHTGEKPFQCIVCGRAFAQKSNVKKHMTTHKVWPSGISNTLPKQPDPVLEESGGGTAVPPDTTHTSFIIPVADSALELPPMAAESDSAHNIVESTDNLDAAAEDKHNNKALAEKFQEDNSKGDHKVKVIVDNSYICQYCPAKFKTYYKLKTHLVKHKNEQMYKCMMKSCGQSFHDLDTFLKHVKTHENEMTYRCHKCHKYFPSLYELGVHQFTHNLYPGQGLKSGGPRHFQCTKCGNKYTTPEALEHHMATTTHDYRCPHCEKQFTCERFLRRHLPIHGTDGQFECSYCHKTFKTEHYLKIHILIHTGETPFSCHLCHAMFNRKDKLKRHMTIHDVVKKYRCPFRNVAGCTKEFNRPDKLKAHIITHSGIKPYKCSVCQKGFSRKPHLMEHERGHRSDYRYKCDTCGKGFFRSKLFKDHKCSSTTVTDQIFRPRNKRKIGRPKRRVVTITADSIAKCRGKKYVSRTRGRDKSPKQSLGTSIEELTASLKEEQTISANAVPEVKEDSPSKTVIQGVFDEQTKTVSVELVNALPLMSGGDCTAGLIDYDGTGIGVDHYVVHLAESVDGSSSMQTAFIPTVSGNQIFTTTSGSVGLQPIAIIEAAHSSDRVSLPVSSVSTNDIANTLMMESRVSQDGHQNGCNMIFSLARKPPELSLAENSGKMVMVDSLLQDVSNSSKSVHIVCENMNMSRSLVNGQSSHLLDSEHPEDMVDNFSLHEKDGNKRGNLIVLKNGGLNGVGVGGSVDTEVPSDMIDMSGSLALFQASSRGSGLVEGQVVVSGSQAFLTCPSQLVDCSGDTVYKFKSPL